MKDTIAMLLSDTYKQTHNRMYPKGLTKLVSYWVPRKSMLETQDKMVFFGLRAFIQKWLIDYFNENFFNLLIAEVIVKYDLYMDTQIGRENYDLKDIVDLHRLGRLPIAIRALPEGTLVPMGVPCIEITNTHPDFAWVVQFVECLLQVELWKPCAHATIGHMYRQEAEKWYSKTVVGASPDMACADFGMRGMSCMDEATRCSAAWLLSFNKTSTIPALDYIDSYYDAKTYQNRIGIGAVSTEHSVMGANFAIDGDEITFVKRLLTELYPNTSFSMVSDTYDYWNMVENILPQCKKEIMAHNGKLLVRPDSGDIVDISVRTVEKLWEIFGGTVNSKGYKVLDPHVGIIYGDGCTLQNVSTIWEKLEEKGFAANNIVFGVGAFCFSAIMENGKMVVVTRDTFGIAMKATYGVINGKPLMIYKDPKTDTGHLKKSHKGCCRVYEENGELKCQDQLMNFSSDTLLEPVFIEGMLLKKETFEEIRKRLNKKDTSVIPKMTDYFLQLENSYNRLEEEFIKYGKLIFCVDYDDTLYDFHKKGRTYQNIIELLHRWELYSEVIIFTGNGEDKYPEIEKYLQENGIKYKGINCDASVTFPGRKIYANVYIDDRGGLWQVYKELSLLINRIEKGEVKHE